MNEEKNLSNEIFDNEVTEENYLEIFPNADDIAQEEKQPNEDILLDNNDTNYTNVLVDFSSNRNIMQVPIAEYTVTEGLLLISLIFSLIVFLVKRW